MWHNELINQVISSCKRNIERVFRELQWEENETVCFARFAPGMCLSSMGVTR